MYRPGFLVLILVGALLSSGCATIKNYPERTVNLPKDVKALNDKFSLEEYLKQTDEADEAKKESYRNDFINAKILTIDQSFETFQEDLVRESGLKDLGADWANLALTGATAVVPLAQTKTVLSAIATGITGAKGSVDTNLFFKKTVVALITQMKADRESKRTDILTKMDLPIKKYPLTLALTDLEEYYKAGTLPQALISISATAGTKISAQKGAQKALFEKYGASIEAPLAPAAEVQEVKKLFEDLKKLKEPDREKQAKLVIDSFQKISSEKNPAPNASNLDNVEYLYGLAIRADGLAVRTALTQAFNEAKPKTKSQ